MAAADGGGEGVTGGGEWVALPQIALERMVVPGALPFVAVSVVLMLTAAAFVVTSQATPVQ